MKRILLFLALLFGVIVLSFVVVWIVMMLAGNKNDVGAIDLQEIDCLQYAGQYDADHGGPYYSPLPISGDDSLCVSESLTPSPTPEATPEESATPSATPAPDLQPSRDDSPKGPFNAPPAPICRDIKFTPTIIGFERNDPTSVTFKWSKVDDFVSSYIIWYGVTDKADMWNAIITGNETTLRFLPANMMVWAKVAGLSDSCQGQFSAVVDP